MKTRKLKRLVAGLLTFSLALGVVSRLETETEACPMGESIWLTYPPPVYGALKDDWHGGIHDCKGIGTDIQIYVLPSAINSVLSMTGVYKGVATPAFGWDGISGSGSGSTSPYTFKSKVTITTATPPPYPPSIPGVTSTQVRVIGENLGSYSSLTGRTGEIRPYDHTGMIELYMNEDWSRIVVVMNNDTTIWGNTSIPLAQRQERARHTFFHEVGHTLKMKHPSSCEEISVMNGWPHDVAKPAKVATSIKLHDILSMSHRWTRFAV